MSLDDARRKCEAWRRDHNEERPHSTIGNKAPIELIDRSVAYGALTGTGWKKPAAWSKDGEQSIDVKDIPQVDHFNGRRTTTIAAAQFYVVPL
jgi:Integrase core domain